MEPRKQAIIAALRAFAKQRPGMDPRNYGSWRDYRNESARVTQQLADVHTLLAAVSGQDAITADTLLAEAGSGDRLSITDHYGDSKPAMDVHCFTVEWCTGQYWPTEYRAGVARFLSAVLWAHAREHGMPPPLAGEGDRMYSGFEPGHKSPTAMSAGDWLRAHFKREFGRRIASRYFD